VYDRQTIDPDVASVTNIAIVLWAKPFTLCNASKIFAVGFSFKKK
jgi:hypothetical protein